MPKIFSKNDKILRKVAAEVPIENIKSEKIQKIIADMREVLAREEEGVAIAAPQVGAALRIFIISGKVLKMKEAREKIKEKDKTLDSDDVVYPDLIFINPEITKTSKTAKLMEEGCLSVRWWYGEVRRAVKATIRAFDEDGKIFTRGASGLMAQIFQHEIDHLNGILFTDKAKKLRETPPPNEEKA